MRHSASALVLVNRPTEVRRQYIERLRAAFPDVRVTLAEEPSVLRRQIAEAQILVTEPTSVEESLLRDAVELRWIHAVTSGTDGIAELESLRSEVMLTSSRGVHTGAMSEAALMAMLALSRDLPRAIRNQARRVWARWPAALLEGKTVGILGVGAIGVALAEKCRALGMHIVGFSRARRVISGLDEVRLWTELHCVLGRCDFVVSLLPSSPETRGVIGRELLESMRPSAYLINLGRGDVVDDEALVEALRSGRIAGAALDVFREEPLPASHPFWGLDNVIVTPHLGGAFEGYVERAWPIIETNMRAFLRGDLDAMVNIVRHEPAFPT